MDNVDLQVLKAVRDWRAAGHRVVLGTVTRTWGSAPRPVGALVALRDDGQMAGSVSGGCIEDDLVARVRAGERAAEPVQIVRYGVAGDEAARFGLPCGGTIELVMETVSEASAIDALLARLERGERVRRRLDRASGAVELSEAREADALRLDAEVLVSVHGPSWRLLIIGAGQLTQYLASMALALDYEVLVCDPREEHAATWALPGVKRAEGMPDDAVTALRPDAHTAVIALSHDPKLDDLALIEALQGPAFYVGAIGSHTNQRKRRERLEEHFGLSAAQLDRLHGPVGLKNGARTPPELAVSILAELTAARHGYRIPAPVPLAGLPAAEPGCAA
ncbi:MAG TPA: XdhC family protein [Methylibium sp.]|uniref:XdhC family protein n=1 Tax=Methylibium sp. TaxID=2067992 RepID=UPI002DBF6A2D|nr:XdhC family protein [Methylibium sp.]HEU4457720.1 XdhC family protein [Methylibium sp.]